MTRARFTPSMALVMVCNSSARSAGWFASEDTDWTGPACADSTRSQIPSAPRKSLDEETKENQHKRKPNKMKAITMRMQKFSRPGVILLATVVAIITSMVVANATQSITTPNAAFISYSLATGANSAPITPATNRSVLVMDCCTTAGHQSVGQVSLLHDASG